MGLAFIPASIALCFQGDHFVLLRRYLLLMGTTGFFRPVTFCVTHMPDSCPESPTNQYPFFSHVWLFVNMHGRWCSS